LFRIFSVSVRDDAFAEDVDGVALLACFDDGFGEVGVVFVPFSWDYFDSSVPVHRPIW